VFLSISNVNKRTKINKCKDQKKCHFTASKAITNTVTKKQKNKPGNQTGVIHTMGNSNTNSATEASLWVVPFTDFRNSEDGPMSYCKTEANLRDSNEKVPFLAHYCLNY
jgi:hypothetical protein